MFFRPVRSLKLFVTFISVLVAVPTVTAQSGPGVTFSVGYFDVNLISGGGLAGGFVLDVGKLHGSFRLDVGFAEVPISDDYVSGEPEMLGSACIERATGEKVAEVLCLGASGFDVYYGAFSLEAGYVLPLPLYVAVGAGVRNGEELDREDGKTVATRPYGTALARHPLTERISGYVQVQLGPAYLQGGLGLVFFIR